MRTQSPLSRSETRFLHTLYQSYAGPLYRVPTTVSETPT